MWVACRPRDIEEEGGCGPIGELACGPIGRVADARDPNHQPQAPGALPVPRRAATPPLAASGWLRR